MNSTKVTTQGQEGARPGREAPPGFGRPTGQASSEARRYRANGKRRPQDEEFRSYYGLPVINKPVWEAKEIAGYFFLGGLAGASSTMALLAQVTGRRSLARAAKLGAAGAIGLSLVALVKDLGRPMRFLNMLRVFKPTSPMNIGTWVVSAYAPAAMAAAASEVTGWFPVIGAAGTAGAAFLGPAVASYTGVLISNTAVPAWHGGRAHMPYVFVCSAAMAASGLGLLAADGADAGPATRLALAATVGELAMVKRMESALEPEVAKAYHEGKPGALLRASKALSTTGAVAGALGALAARRPGLVARAGAPLLRKTAGMALLGASACTRFGIFHAGMASAQDPMATISPQKRRLEGSAPGGGASTGL